VLATPSTHLMWVERHLLCWVPYRKQWLKLALSKGPNKVGVSSLTWGWKQIRFPKRCVLWILEYRTMD
jgi:hypothetical protein